MTRSSESHHTVLKLSSLNMGGKVLAIAKTLVIAAMYGTSGTLDAFWVAYSLPLILPMLLTTVITVAFVPRFVKNLHGRTGPEAWSGANTLFTLAIVTSVAASIAIFCWPDWLVDRLAPGLAPDTKAQAIVMIRMMLPCMVMLTMSSLLSALSNARERFLLSSMDGVVNNIAIILVALLFSKALGVRALIVGVTLGFATHLAILCIGNRDLLRTSIRPSLDLRHPDFLKPLAHLLPLFVGAIGATFTSLINQYFVSKLDEGSISALTYATMIAMLPVEVFAQAVITSYYPALGRHAASGDRGQLAKAYKRGQRVIFLFTIPCAVALVALAQPVVVLLLERGRFDANSTALTVDALHILAASTVFRAAAYFSYRVLHSMIMPWTQVIIGLLGVATNIGLNILWTERLGLQGVALSTLISQVQSAVISGLVVAWLLRLPATRAEKPDLGAWAGLVVPVVLFSVILLAGRALIPASVYASSHRLWAFACCALALPAAVASFWVAWLMRVPEVLQIGEFAGRRMAGFSWLSRFRKK